MKDEGLEKILRDLLSMIKRKKTQTKYSVGSEEVFTTDKDEVRLHVPGQGIVEGERKKITENILSCGHPASIGVGHRADCGHYVCRECLEQHGLVCAEQGCYRKFCTVKKCRNKPHMFAGLPFCGKHKISIAIELNSLALVHGRKYVANIVADMREQYKLKHSISKRKDLPHGRENLPR